MSTYSKVRNGHHAGAVTRKRCASCGLLFNGESWQRLCWDCWRADRDREEIADRLHAAYNRGYRDGERANTTARDAAYGRGYADGQREAASLPPGLLGDLIRLCHPDRHPPERSELANRVTARLLEMKDGDRP